jgi:hypothetical protein
LPKTCGPRASTRKPHALPRSSLSGVAMIFSTSADSLATKASDLLAEAVTAV